MSPLLLTLLIGMPPEPDPTTASIPRKTFEADYFAILKATRTGRPFKPQTAVPELVRVHGQLPSVTDLPKSKRARYRVVLEVRMIKQYRHLIAEQKRLKRKGQQVPSVEKSASEIAEEASQTGRGGGAVPPTAQQLIDLIVNTVAPETWQQFGGQGTIMFWPRPPALIIRQSHRAHEEIGGTLRQLRR